MWPTLYVDGEAQQLDDQLERVHVDVDDNGEQPKYRCSQCGDDLPDADEPGAVPETECPNNDDQPHDAESIPLAWVNHAAISLDEKDDAVHVSISVGDPRGAFVFTVRRLPDTAHEHPGRLIMHTPYPGEGMPHEVLTQLHDGTFLIG